MGTTISDWVSVLTRWFHIIVGISWIGQTYLFIHFERNMGRPPDTRLPDGVAGQMWMVHGGRFYVIEKLTGLDKLPFKLHWFKWESMLTWLSGMILLIVVYYVGGLMVGGGSGVSSNMAVAIAVGAVLLAWPAYGLVWRSPLGRSEIVGSIVSFALVLAIAYGLKQVLPARAAFFHIGAMFGTVMAANVWLLIIPSQKRIVAMVKSGRLADMALSRRARQASKHNSYMSVPLILMMISNHCPTVSYGSQYSVWLLGGYLLVGWLGARVIRDGVAGLVPVAKKP